MVNTVDYIIAGGGISGLLLANEMANSSWFDNKQILIIDQFVKSTNDRTICYWSKDQLAPDYVSKSWKHFNFYNYEGEHKLLDTDPYEYCMIRSADFYNHVHYKIDQKSNITLITDKIIDLVEMDDGMVLKTEESNSYKCKHLFKSFITDELDFTKDHHVLQHFKGIFIETEESCFDPNHIHFMDFRTDQSPGTCFFYVLPTSDRHALVELAVFSDEVWEDIKYDQTIEAYISAHLTQSKYSIQETEFGVIPMTTYNFSAHDTKRITNIGTSGGTVKPSSGYSYTRSLRHCKAICQALISGKEPQIAQRIFSKKYKWFDQVFLNVILSNKLSGAEVFDQLFAGTKAERILSFLNEDLSLLEDIAILKSPKKVPFIRAALEEIF